MNKLIILGSSRKDGNTAKIARAIQEKTDWDIIDLNSYEIKYYDYSHKNSDDDYLPLMKEIIANYDTYVFATPVYWYSMSGIMKVFFDRLTDLLTIEKDLGRKMRGKYMAAISSSGGGNLGEQFWLPFEHSATYMGMTFIGGIHTQLEADKITAKDRQKIDTFIKLITEKVPSS